METIVIKKTTLVDKKQDPEKVNEVNNLNYRSSLRPSVIVKY